ncbi:monovalent cation/H+ antiporter complex subunit F [Corynebacterium sanguinis]|uniref:Cation:proton antiporter n=1 Tax=Corynebacterium sanguinis TaxID=2594913 RepID=A0A6C1TUA2_9CORY|nr:MULTISPECIES: monovalent cation/H+ antiporter complex subunit F [Corynebacterium]MBA4504973.1 cation:proton antiporter [Corynebacterium sanguinis]MCT1411561.1 monovalent cation/H+ antiporter complex subunit F [Corynebacterium sanguinis]MCT1424996.1 monovalent cation/H+ antiporter complex subunit F [Corynebacterium sanguinis]MCT1445585.1 monovalent cation/H+ antiporter complex subunit F [Corynebacterium sanguinis]MCT1492463.1 monovalent cation/H+ antiporter complex subunit F [Corynebacterium
MDPTIYNIFLGIAAAALVVGFFTIAWRVVVGPNSLDRAIGNDAIAASLQCVLALYICWSLDTTVVNVMIVIALLGFIASAAIARFHKKDDAL